MGCFVWSAPGFFFASLYRVCRLSFADVKMSKHKPSPSMVNKVNGLMEAFPGRDEILASTSIQATKADRDASIITKLSLS